MHSLGPGLDRWGGSLAADEQGLWTLSVEGWSDPYATWEHDATIKIAADVDTELMLAEGAVLLRRAVAQVPRTPAQARPLLDAVTALEDPGRPAAVRLAAATSAQVQRELAERPLRDLVTASEPQPVLVERERALYGSWYEFFPRSEGARQDRAGAWRSGTFRTAMDRLPAVAAMGFDILYLPPIHPIGRVNRKGPNNTLNPGPGDPGSPWAIGSDEGGHDTIHPDLGTFADFDAFVARAGELGLEVALDLALQCAPDHPWATSHPEWFTTRVDGSIAYAENPPKKYQDIYPINFDNDPEGIYQEVLRIVRLWMSHGIKTFRVDNPHTKPVSFWERLIGQLRIDEPDLIFLAEAFTRPAMMNTLGRVGFQQSYTYFTWRNAKWEIEEYLTRAVRRCGGVVPAQLLRQHPGHPHRVPAVRRADGLPAARRPRGHPGAELGRLRRLRALRARGPARRRGVPRQREVPVPAAGLGGVRAGRRQGGARPWRRTSPSSTGSGGSTPRCTPCATCGSTRPTTLRPSSTRSVVWSTAATTPCSSSSTSTRTAPASRGCT